VKRASRLLNIPPYPFARWAEHVANARRQGADQNPSVDVIRLDVGNPDTPPPDEVIETLCQSAHQPDHHGYFSYRGLPALREAIAAYYERRFGVVLDPDTEVLPLIGSKEGIVNMALACLDPGDLALVPDPGYAPYAMGAALAGAEVYAFPLLAERGFLPDLNAIPADVADRAILMWLNYPNNPTGATADADEKHPVDGPDSTRPLFPAQYPADEKHPVGKKHPVTFFARAVDFARQHGLFLCHDAPYCDVTYDGYVAPSILQVPGASEVAVEFNSLSKTFNMAGWRVGMAVGNADALAALAQVKSNVDSGLFRPLQEAAIRALSASPEWISARNRVYEQRLEIILAGLNAAGMPAARPRAALYVWARVPTEWNSEEFALALLKQTGVALAPGSFFGATGAGYVRISVTAPSARIRTAMDRLCQFARSPAISQDT